MINVKSLTTKEVARLCRVSDATVKRWHDAGLLISERTNGGHRRFRAEEVARFQRESNLGLKIFHGDESAKSATSRRKARKTFSTTNFFAEGSVEHLFFNALIAGREEEASNILINQFLHNQPLCEIFDNVISKCLRAIGELWYRGEISIAQEHLATHTTLSAVHKLRTVVPVTEPNNLLAMCCAIEDDFHELPTHLVQILLESKGWEVFNFRANMPLYTFADEILHYSPNLVCISATIISDLERFLRDYKEFQSKTAKLKIPIVLGGRIFADEILRQRFTADFYPKNFTEFSEFVENIVKTSA